jgi:hypothetical protein
MNETAERSGVRLDTPEGHGTVVAFPDEVFSHLHFDRRTRAWHGPDEIVLETVGDVEQSGTLQMRCA